MKNYLQHEYLNKFIENIIKLKKINKDDIELIIPFNLHYQIQDGKNTRDFFRNDHAFYSSQILIIFKGCRYAKILYENEPFEELKKYIRINIKSLNELEEISFNSNGREHEIDTIKLKFKNYEETEYWHVFEDAKCYELRQNTFYLERIAHNSYMQSKDYSEEIINDVKKLKLDCTNF
jgi:hypothetical protein